MLPYPNRLRKPAQFRLVIASGQRARRGCLVVHYLAQLPDTDVPSAERPDPARPIVGFVVSRAVGGSVVRHQLSRRLRAQVSTRLDALPTTSATVVRALPAAANADSATIGRDLDSALGSLRARS